MALRKITMQDVLSGLPDIKEIDFKQFEGKSYDLLIQAVGFEPRTIGIAEKLSKLGSNRRGEAKIRLEEVLLIKYETNIEDNLFHLNQLNDLLKPISGLITPLDLNNSFDEIIRNKINSALKAKSSLNVLVDISTMSSRLILLLTKILFQSKDIHLTIFFTEAKVYYPTESSYKSMLRDEKKALENAQTYGVGKVFVSPDYNGGSKDNQDLVICFPSFTAERTEAIISNIDDLILKQKDKDRLIWIVGDPHLEDEKARENRKKMQIEINKIPKNNKTYTVCTFDYKKTLDILDFIYKDVYSKYHINISDLGSKMQSFGIALYCNLRRDVTVYYSEPVKYNSAHYSDGIKDFWMIPVGITSHYLNQLFKVDTVELTPD